MALNPRSSPYNVAVIGYGFSAKVFQIPLICVDPKFKLHAIVQRNPNGDCNAAKDFPNVKIYHEIRHVMEDTDVDLVVVSTIPTSHFDIASQALHAGKHVVLEKPACPSTTEVDALIALAKSKHRLLTVYQNRRWDTDFLTVRSLIDQGKLGKIVEFESHFDRYAPDPPSAGAWQSNAAPGSGILYDLGTHLIDQIVVLFGLPRSVTGFVSKLTQNNVDDACTIMLHYDGMLATVKATVLSAERKQLRFWIRGDKEGQIMSGKSVLDSDFGVEPSVNSGTLSTSWGGGKITEEVWTNIKPLTYRTFYGELAKALADETATPVDVLQARDVIKIIELAKQSSVEGRTLDM